MLRSYAKYGFHNEQDTIPILKKLVHNLMGRSVVLKQKEEPEGREGGAIIREDFMRERTLELIQ